MCTRDLRGLVVAVSTRETVGGFSVDTRHKTRAECPACESVEDLYHLGYAADHGHCHSGRVVGWVCSSCESEVLELLDSRYSTVDLVDVGNKSEVSGCR